MPPMNTLVTVCLPKKDKPSKQHIADPKVMAKAFRMYMTGKANDDICCECNIRAATLKQWALSNQWDDRYDALIKEGMTDVKTQYETMMSVNILQVAQRAFMSAEKLNAHIDAQLSTGLQEPKALAVLARAHAASIKMLANIFGLGKATKKASKKQSPVQYNLRIPDIPSNAPHM